MVEYDKVIYM